MAGFNPNRVLKGVRKGGQFDHARHAESTLTLASPAPVSEPAQTLPQPSHEDLANAAHEHLLTSLREAQQLTPMDRALAAYATRTHRSGTFKDYLPELHDRLPTRDELMAAMLAFEDAPRGPNTDTH